MNDMPNIPDNFCQGFFEFWRRVRCPKCAVVNWVYDSHSERNYPDVRDGVKCHGCSSLFWMGTKEDFLVRYAGELEDQSFEEVLDNWFCYQEGRPSHSTT